jgi:hypothetical protein
MLLNFCKVFVHEMTDTFTAVTFCQITFFLTWKCYQFGEHALMDLFVGQICVHADKMSLTSEILD